MKGAWPEELPNVLWAYRTTARTLTGETPFKLTYGIEAVIPVEVGVTSTRRAAFSEEENDDKLRLNLDYLDEVREEASCRMTKYQRKMAEYYKKKGEAETARYRRSRPLQSYHSNKGPSPRKARAHMGRTI